MRRCAQGTEVCRSACVFGPEFRNVVQPQRPAYMHALSVLLGRLADEPVSPRAFQGLFRQPISCHRWCDSGHALCAGDRRCRRLEVTIQLERRFPRASGVFAVFGSVQLESFCLLAHHTHTHVCVSLYVSTLSQAATLVRGEQGSHCRLTLLRISDSAGGGKDGTLSYASLDSPCGSPKPLNGMMLICVVVPQPIA